MAILGQTNLTNMLRLFSSFNWEKETSVSGTPSFLAHSTTSTVTTLPFIISKHSNNLTFYEISGFRRSVAGIFALLDWCAELFTLLPYVPGQRIGRSYKDHNVQAESVCGEGWFATDVSGQPSYHAQKSMFPRSNA
jgi:hypothetical protein